MVTSGGGLVAPDDSKAIHGEVGLKQPGAHWYAIRKVADNDVPLYGV